MKILIIEDDEKILKILKKGLEEEGFLVDIADDSKNGLYMAEEFNYDAIILDWMLPLMSGKNICKKIREQKINTPILMLSAKNSIEEKIDGLNFGCDDYMCKPFNFAELVARLKSLIRRSLYNFNESFKIDTLEIDIQKRVATRSGKNINLTNKEFEILTFLANNQDTLVTHTQIQDRIWGLNEITSSNIINVFIHHLRQKIDIKGEVKLIKTIRGSGYKLGIE